METASVISSLPETDPPNADHNAVIVTTKTNTSPTAGEAIKKKKRRKKNKKAQTQPQAGSQPQAQAQLQAYPIAMRGNLTSLLGTTAVMAGSSSGLPANNPVPIAPKKPAPVKILAEWAASNLVDSTTTPISKEDVRLLASYNWVAPQGSGKSRSGYYGNRYGKKKSNVILVPGSPCIWNPPALPATVRPDDGLNYIDQNAHNSPGCPLEPLLLSLSHMQNLPSSSNTSNFSLNDVDIITDRSNLRRLLNFASGKVPKDCKVGVEWVNNTLLLTRIEKKNTGFIQSKVQIEGYGHEFEHMFTRMPNFSAPREIKKVTGHHRVVGYKFGRLRMVVRFEADGELPAALNSAATTTATTSDTEFEAGRENLVQLNRGTSGANQLAGVLSELNIVENTNNTTTTGTVITATAARTSASISAPIISPRILVHKFGVLNPQSQIIELKTRPERSSIGVQACMPQLWFSDTRVLIVGLHSDGVFHRVRQHVINDDIITEWEKAQKENLGKLEDLLIKVAEAAKVGKATGERMRLGLAKQGRMRLETGGTGGKLDAVPEDLRVLWEGCV